jgi:hypothetical protein
MPIASMNPDRPSGFQPVGTVYGTSYFGNMRLFPANSSSGNDLFRGDLVIQESTGNVEVAGTGAQAQVLGVFMGVSDVSLRSVANVAAWGQYDTSEQDNADLLVAVGTGLIVEGQEDGDTTPLVLADLGINIGLIYTHTGPNTYGLSGMEFDSTDKAATSTYPFRLLALARKPNNELSSVSSDVTPNARWLAVVNTGLGQVATGI